MKLKRDKLFRRLEAHKQFMSPAERATHKRKRDARKKKEKRAAMRPCAECGAKWVTFAGGKDAGLVHMPWCPFAPAPAVDPEDLTSPLPAETMAEVSEGKLK